MSGKVVHKVGERKTLRNGAVGEWKMVNGKNGKRHVGFRIVQGAHPKGSQAAKDAMAVLRAQRAVPITKAQAQGAYDKWYKRTHRVGVKGNKRPRYASPRGRRGAATYDKGHTSNVVADSRYLRRPDRYDFEGVDTGKTVRKVRTANQKANDAKLGARTRARNAARRPVGLAALEDRGQVGGEQEGGFWW
jgi:hypothetical protein